MAARKSCAWDCAAPGASASPSCSNVSLNSPVQLWRSLPATRKTQLPGPGNRAGPITDLPYYLGSTDVSGLSHVGLRVLNLFSCGDRGFDDRGGVACVRTLQRHGDHGAS